MEKVYVRGDCALYENEALRYMDDSKIGYAISAKMSAGLRAVVESVDDSEVARRYIAIRIRKRQGHFFADGTDRCHFAVVTNLDWEGEDCRCPWRNSTRTLSKASGFFIIGGITPKSARS